MLDLHQEELDRNIAAMPTTKTVEPGFWQNVLSGSGSLTMRGLAEIPRAASMAASVVPIGIDALTNFTMGRKPPFKETTAAEKYFKWHDDVFNRAVDYWTPGPAEVGTAGQIIGSLIPMIGTVIASPALAVAVQGMAQPENLVRKYPDVTAAEAVGVGAAQAAGLAVGIWLPATIGTNLATRVGVGVGINVAQGVATRAASAAILGDKAAAKDYDPLDPVGITLDVLLGGAFGGAAHYIPRMRSQSVVDWNRFKTFAQGLKPSEVDAIATLRVAQHLNTDSMPGQPLTPRTVQRHYDAMRQALDQLHRGEPVNVADTMREGAQPIVSGKPVEQTTPPPDGIPPHVIAEGGEAPQVAAAGRVEPGNVNVDSGVKIEPESTVPRTELPEAAGRQEDGFASDPARERDARIIGAHIQGAAERVRLEEGLPRPPEPTRARPPNDITRLPPEDQAFAVAQHIERKLIDAGQQRGEATANAAIWGAFAKSAWERYGITPADLMARYGVDVRRMDSADQLLGALEQPVFHGSPHDFDQFRLDKIGTGEGAQAYGWGLYFAENPKIAHTYHKQLAKTTRSHNTYKGKKVSRQVIEDAISKESNAAVADTMRKLGPALYSNGEIAHEAIQDAIAMQVQQAARMRELEAKDLQYQRDGTVYQSTYKAADYKLMAEAHEKQVKMLRQIAKDFARVDEQKSGAVYQVDIPDTAVARMLDWDKPLRKQTGLPEGAADAVLNRLADWKREAYAGEPNADGDVAYWVERYTNANAGDVYKDLALALGSKKAASEALRAAGIPGIKYLDAGSRGKEGGTRNLVVFDDSLIKITHKNGKPLTAAEQRTFFQSDTGPFYSELTRQIDGLKINTAPAKGWQDAIKGLINKGVVKPAEVEAVGLREWLELQDGKVSKQQVQEFLAANGVRVEEVELGNTSIRDDLQAEFDAGVPMSDRDIDALREAKKTADTKFSQYQLPGGQNYRELLLMLPEDSPARQALFNERSKIEQAGGLLGGHPNVEANRARVREINAELQRNFQSPFKSSHFDQPNILAHVRFNERVDADGKRVLFLEELQSDWAQKGKREGFKDDSALDQLRELVKQYDALNDERLAARKRATELPDANDEFIQLIDRTTEIGRQLDDLQIMMDNLRSASKSEVPSAPFVGKTDQWVSLSLKRMIRYAAENGFDRVAWTNGEQQAARYDLSKHIETIGYKSRGENLFDVSVWAKNGNREILKNQSADAKWLEDNLGKEIAEKIVKGVGRSDMGFKYLEDLDLKVGGEGMKAFYDKIVPNVANDVLKKLGGGRVGEIGLGRVEKGVLMSDRPYMTQPGFDITPAVAKKALAGMPLFQGGARGAVSFNTGETIIQLFQKADKSTFQHETGHVFLQMTRDLATSPDAPMAAAQDWATIAKWLGVEGGEITRAQHEQWARGWEKYLAEGTAPNEGLKAAFKQFRDWLLEIYHSLAGIDSPINNQIRGVMARMLDSQAKDPISPRGLQDARLQTPEYRQGLEMMARESGWAEEGGHITRDPLTNEVNGRTPWIAHADWYQRMQQDEKARLPGGRRGVERAVQKAIMGEAMGIQERRAVTFMLDEHARVLKTWEESGAAAVHPDGDPFEMANARAAEGLDDAPSTVLDMALIDRARDLDPDAVESIPNGFDDAQFMARIREIIDAKRTPAENTTRSGQDEGRPQTESAAPREVTSDRGPPPGAAGDDAGDTAGTSLSNAAQQVADQYADVRVRIGTDPDGTPLYGTLNDMLEEARLQRELADQDADLFRVAGECLLGVI